MSSKDTILVTFVGVVYPNFLDHMGHMNVQFYAYMFDQATWSFFSEFGITSSYMKENHRGMAAVNQKTEYLLELFAGDVVEISTEPLEVKEKSLRFLHTMTRRPKGEVIARSELVSVHFDTGLHKSSPIPGQISEKLQDAIL